jgi:hypothetical protein
LPRSSVSISTRVSFLGQFTFRFSIHDFQSVSSILHSTLFNSTLINEKRMASGSSMTPGDSHERSPWPSHLIPASRQLRGGITIRPVAVHDLSYSIDIPRIRKKPGPCYDWRGYRRQCRCQQGIGSPLWLSLFSLDDCHGSTRSCSSQDTQTRQRLRSLRCIRRPVECDHDMLGSGLPYSSHKLVLLPYELTQNLGTLITSVQSHRLSYQERDLCAGVAPPLPGTRNANVAFSRRRRIGLTPVVHKPQNAGCDGARNACLTYVTWSMTKMLVSRTKRED